MAELNPADRLSLCRAVEELGPLIAWLCEQAAQAADADQSTDAGMLTWAAQVVGECIDKDAPAPVAEGERQGAPAEGDVAELVAWLRRESNAASICGEEELHQFTARAAAQLQQQAAELERLRVVPVAVGERLPEPGDCDAEGFIWLWDCDRRWVRQHRDAATSNTWTGAHWLPGWFLPLPSGEVLA